MGPQLMPRLVFIKCKTAEEAQVIETNFACERTFDITFERDMVEPVTRSFTLETMDEGRKGEGVASEVMPGGKNFVYGKEWNEQQDLVKA